MLIDARSNLRGAIVEVLSREPLLDAVSLSKRVACVYRNCSKQGLYKELRKLESQGVVVRQIHRYCLRLPWIIELGELATRIDKVYSSASYLASLLGDKGTKHSWLFSDLRRADLYWTQLSLALHNSIPCKNALAWARHPWFLFCHPQREAEFVKVISRSKMTALFLEGDGYFDRFYQAHYRTPRYSIHTGVKLAIKHAFDSVEVVGDHLIAVSFDQATRTVLDKAIVRIRNKSDLLQITYERTFWMKARIKITLECNSRKAEALRVWLASKNLKENPKSPLFRTQKN